MNTILSLQTIPPQKKLIKDLYVLTMDDWKGGGNITDIVKEYSHS